MDYKFLKKSANELLEKFKNSTSINDYQVVLLEELLALRDAEILSKYYINEQKLSDSDTIPPDPITLIDNK